LGGNRGTRRKTTRRRGGLQSAPPPPADSALAGTDLKLISDLNRKHLLVLRLLLYSAGSSDLLALPSLCLLLPVLRELLVKVVSVRDRKTDTLHQKARQGPGQELACLLQSSAARSSVRAILLLLPVFGPRPGNVRWTAGSGG